MELVVYCNHSSIVLVHNFFDSHITHDLTLNQSTFHYILVYNRYFQHAHFIPLVGVGKRGAY